MYLKKVLVGISEIRLLVFDMSQWLTFNLNNLFQCNFQGSRRITRK